MTTISKNNVYYLPPGISIGFLDFGRVEIPTLLYILYRNCLYFYLYIFILLYDMIITLKIK